MSDEPVRFPTRVALVLRDDLEAWQVANVAAFLASGVASDPALAGDDLDLAGVAVQGAKNQVDRVLEGVRRHR